jgi:hypothetical protein
MNNETTNNIDATSEPTTPVIANPMQEPMQELAVEHESRQSLSTDTLYDLEPLKSEKKSPGLARLLQTYLILVIAVNFSLLFLKGYSQDLGYWQDWVGQLAHKGYEGFNGNYPPLYVHWLYVVGQFYTLSGIPLEHNDLLKFLTQLPVTLFHCLLTALVFKQLTRTNISQRLMHAILLLTALNPAILVNGPIWGQVDLVPAVMVFGAILLATHERWAYLAIPLFILALLTKFQMIAFAPVFGFLFFRNIGKNIYGIGIAIIIGALVFLPAILAGHFWPVFRQAYIDTLGQYPMTTFNAANIWIILTGNTAPDSILLFGTPSDSIWVNIFTAKYFGMLLFSLTALCIFLQGIYILVKSGSKKTTSERLLPHAFFTAMICALAFFTLLPAMHERYLFPAAIMALSYSTLAPKKIIYPIWISLLCALNMLIILEINGSDIWLGLSWLTIVILAISFADLLSNGKTFNGLYNTTQKIMQIPFIALWFFLAATLVMSGYLINKYQIHELHLDNNQVFLTDLPLNYAKQDHGTIAINRSYDGNYLSLSNRRYAQGIGTHAASDIQYELPENAATFSFMAALDDEVGTADVQFSIWGDGRLLWESTPIMGYERDIPTHTVNVIGVRKLTLKIAPLKDDKWDHADWVNTVVTLQKQANAIENPTTTE